MGSLAGTAFRAGTRAQALTASACRGPLSPGEAPPPSAVRRGTPPAARRVCRRRTPGRGSGRAPRARRRPAPTRTGIRYGGSPQASLGSSVRCPLQEAETAAGAPHRASNYFLGDVLGRVMGHFGRLFQTDL